MLKIPTSSKQTSGATANSLGQLAQTEIVNFLTKELGDKYKIIRNGYIIIDGYDKKGGMPFDLVVEKGMKNSENRIIGCWYAKNLPKAPSFREVEFS